MNITIDQSLIELLGKKLYSSHHAVILVRELLQNSIDACSNTSKPIIDLLINDSTITCVDNGIGMNEDTLTNTFLSIGASKKLDDSIGGFGIAKVAIFASKYWRVITRDITLDNSLKLGKFDQTGKFTTSVTCVLKEDIANVSNKVRLLVNTCDFHNANVRLNGAKIKSYTGKPIYKDDHHNYTIYTAKKFSIGDYVIKGLLIYRINGLTQYTRFFSSDCDYNVIIDFQGIGYKPIDNDYPFDLSRENIKYSLSFDIEQIIDKLVDKHSKDDHTEKKKSKVINGYHYIECQANQFNTRDKRIAKVFYEVVSKLKEGKSFSRGYVGSCYVGMNSNQGEVYSINPHHFSGISDKQALIFAIFHLAIHEYSHEVESSHNENFTSLEGDYSRRFAYLVNDQTINRLAWYAIKD